MTETLEQAVEIIQAALPEFNVRILPARTIPFMVDPIKVPPKIAVELPLQHAWLRLTLASELRARTGVDISAESRARDAACFKEGDAGTVLTAIRAGKLNGLTILYLDQNTSIADRESAIAGRQGGGSTVDEILDGLKNGLRDLRKNGAPNPFQPG